MNHLQNLYTLKNRYFGLRHGPSLANKRGIIISRPENGLHQYGLIHEARALIRKSVAEAVKLHSLTDRIIIIASDFLRTEETAEEARQVIKARKIYLHPSLRERNFGDLEQTPSSNYQRVWTLDEKDPHHTEFAAESAMAVQDRFTSLVIDCEEVYSGEDIMFVAHGDILQIGQTGFEKISPSRHRSITHWNPAEIRQFILNSNT